MQPSSETPAASAGGLPAGTRLGPYQCIRRLAIGGMAELYLGRKLGEQGFENVVAIKRVLPHLAENEEFVAQFLKETQLAATLDHANIAHVVDFGTWRAERYIVMEYVHGRDVRQILSEGTREGPIPLPVALTIVVEVAAALQYAHEGRGRDGRPMGLIHRDVSPSNVMVGFGGEVKLVDFGIAKATELTNGTQSGAIKGKLRYMSPEQARGETLDNRSDIFSLGILAYELTIGERCFCAEGEFALINRVATGRFDLPSARRVDYPPELERIIVRAMAPQPEQRFPEARSFQLAIERYAAQQGISLSKPQLGEYMRRLFDASPFPTTASIPDVTELGPTTKDATDRSVRSSHPRRRLPVAIAALGIGLAIGVGTGRLDAAWEQPRTEAPAVERDVGSAVAPPTVGRTDMPVPISTAPRRPDEEARESSIVSTPTDAERDAVPSTTPGKSVSKSKSSSEHRRTRREPRAKQPRAETKGGPSGAEAPPMNAEYLPPSMRGRGTP